MLDNRHRDEPNSPRPWTLPTLHHLQVFIFHGKIFYDKTQCFWSCFFELTHLLRIMPNLQRLALHLHFTFMEIKTFDNLEADWSELDSFLATSCSSTKFVILLISTRFGTHPWSDHNIEPYLMEYPNVSRMVEQNKLVIVSPVMRRHCYCTMR